MLDFLVTLGGISLAMSAVIIVMLILQKPIKKRFVALGRYIIWSVIIIRLCLPISLDILPKLVTLPAGIPETEIVIPDTVTPEPVVPEVVTPTVPSSEVVNEPVPDNTTAPIYTPSVSVAEPAPEKPAFEITGEHIVAAMFTAWALGAVTFVIFNLVRYRINAGRIGEFLSVPTAEVWSIYDTVCRELGVKKAPPLYMGRADVSPMVYGFIRPKVVLPSVEMSAQAMTYILRHELTHYKRGDLYFKLIAMLANALHWFNPFAYIACGMMSSEAELSCDESALRKTDLMGRLGYGNSMLEIVKLCRHSPKLTTGFSPKKRAVKERFENMINTDKKKKGYLIVTAVLLVTLLCTSIIGCSMPDNDSESLTKSRYAYQTDEELFEKGELRVNGPEDWRFVHDEKGQLVLSHKDGRSFKYNKVYENKLGIEYTYTHEGPEYMAESYIIGDVGVIRYSASEPESCGRVCMLFIDLNNCDIINSYTCTGDDLLAYYSMTKDDLSPYNKWYGEDWTYRVSAAVCLELDDGRIAFEPFIEARDGDIRCVNYLDINGNSFGELEEGSCTIQKGVYYTDVNKIRDLDGVAQGAVECIEAFLRKDTATLETMAGYPSGLLDAYKTLRFGEYMIRFEDNQNGWPILYVEIEESGIEGIEPGKQQFWYKSVNGVQYMQYSGPSCSTNDPGAEGMELRACNLVSVWISYANEPLIPYGEQYTDDYFAGVMYMLNREYGAETLEEYRREAKRVFGIDILNDVYSDADKKLEEIAELNLYTEAHYYAPLFPRETIESSDSHVILQFFADYGSTIPAYKVKYEFFRDGDDLVFNGSEKYDDTGRDIRDLYYGSETEEVIG